MPSPPACLPRPAAVQQVRPFGVFVKLDGYRKYGLVHFSQVRPQGAGPRVPNCKARPAQASPKTPA